MEFKIYNTLTRQIETFIPHDKNEVTMYTCGPTVYHFAHIGNLRSYIMEDVLQKALEYIGYNVKRCMNITDVGHLSSDADTGVDKMLSGAEREHKSVMEIAQFYTDAFKKDCLALNIKWPEIVVPATSCIEEYIKMIEILIEKGYAYFSNGNIYFDVTKLDEYYKLTNQTNDDLKIGVRDGVQEDGGKHSQQDFVLWFTKSKFESQALKWNSPWGEGYPGWHIECSGISTKYLGEYLDIHCGGVDNKFPHHTNEIAQSEGYLGHKWCNYWFHVEHLNTIEGKMSKSSGKILTLNALAEQGYSPETYRFFCLQSRYRRALTFTYEALDNAKTAYESIIKKIEILNCNNGELENEKIEEFDEKFKKTLCGDLNTAGGITILIDVLKSDLNDKSKIELISRFDKVLGLSLLKAAISNKNKSEVDEETEKYILEKIEERKKAKAEKNYAVADQIRQELTAKGINLVDTKEGTTYSINK